MTKRPSPAAEQMFAALAELRQATVAVSYATLVRQAAAQQPPIQISSKRLSDWFGGKAVPADPAVVRFLVEYLVPRPPAPSTTGGVRCRGGWTFTNRLCNSSGRPIAMSVGVWP